MGGADESVQYSGIEAGHTLADDNGLGAGRSEMKITANNGIVWGPEEEAVAKVPQPRRIIAL